LEELHKGMSENNEQVNSNKFNFTV